LRLELFISAMRLCRPIALGREVWRSRLMPRRFGGCRLSVCGRVE